MEANVDPACVRKVNFTSSVRVETADAQVLEKTVDSRFEKLSDAAIDSLVSEQKNKNTEQATDKWLRLFDEYCKDTGRRCDLSTVTASDLAYILRHAYVEFRPKKAGVKFYSASSLLGFRSAIHRKLVELKRLMNVHSDPAFKDANIALKAFLLKPKKAGRSQSGGAQTPHQRRRHEQAVPLLP